MSSLEDQIDHPQLPEHSRAEEESKQEDPGLASRLSALVCEHTTLVATENKYVFQVEPSAECELCPRKQSLLVVKHDGTVWDCWSKKKPQKIGVVWTEELKFRNSDGSFSPAPIGKQSEFVGQVDSSTQRNTWTGVDVRDYGHETTRIHPISKMLVDHPKAKCIAIRAGMSLGKTYAIGVYLQEYLLANPKARVLCVGCRKSFVSTLMAALGNFNFFHYRFGREPNNSATDEETVVQKTIRILTEPEYELADRLLYLDQVVCDIQRVVDKAPINSDYFQKLGKQLDVFKRIYGRLTLNTTYTTEMEDLKKLNLEEEIVELLRTRLSRIKNEMLKRQQKYLKANRLVIQYESLLKLNGKPKFDLVVIDEARSIVSNMCSKTTNPGNKLAFNGLMLSTLLKASNLAILTDANLEWDQAIPDFIQSMYEPEQIAVRRYHHVAMKRTLHATPDEHLFLATVRAKVNQTIKAERAPIAVCCRTRTKAVAYRDLIEKEFGGNKNVRIEMFTSKSDGEQIRAFEDFPQFMRDRAPDVVILTSSVTGPKKNANVADFFVLSWSRCSSLV